MAQVPACPDVIEALTTKFWLVPLPVPLAAAGESVDWTPEEEEARVEKMTKALRKALGATADRQPDIFRKALERFSPQLAKALEEEYLEAYREAHELDPQ